MGNHKIGHDLDQNYPKFAGEVVYCSYLWVRVNDRPRRLTKLPFREDSYVERHTKGAFA